MYIFLNIHFYSVMYWDYMFYAPGGHTHFKLFIYEWFINENTMLPH